MKIRFCFALLLTFTLAFDNICFAQKQEINAFKEMNKELLKSVKKQYKKEPTVELKDDVFFIVIEGKVNKEKKFMVMNENGDLLTPEPVSSYAPIDIDKNYIWVSQASGNKKLWGAVDYRNGQVVLVPKYDQIHIFHKHDSGFNEKGIWRDAADDGWVAWDALAGETIFFSADGKNVLNKVNGSYEINENNYVVAGTENKYGLYTENGRELFPQKYSKFIITSDGFVITTTTNPSLTPMKLYYGGKTINPSAPQYVIPNNLIDLKAVNGVPHYKVHRDDDWISYAVQPDYKVEYIDEGQKYYDLGDYDKVIAYYEGEGIDAPHGGYYMGMAAKAIGDIELAKLDNVISTLKNSSTYYYPVEWPDKYTFNSSLLGSQFILAQDYFDRFLKNISDINPDDPRVKRAKKYRGETAVARNSIARKLEDYTTAYTTAAQRYATEKTNAEIQRAQQEALSNSIAAGISNLLFGK